MKALYDRNGQPVLWLGDNGRITSRDGQSAFWVAENGSVYDYAGHHRGWWDADHWRGRDGGTLAWLSGAQNLGVIPPIPAIAPIPPIPSVEQIRPIPRIPPVRPVNRMGWSSDAFE